MHVTARPAPFCIFLAHKEREEEHGSIMEGRRYNGASRRRQSGGIRKIPKLAGMVYEHTHKLPGSGSHWHCYVRYRCKQHTQRLGLVSGFNGHG